MIREMACSIAGFVAGYLVGAHAIILIGRREMSSYRPERDRR